MKVGADRFAEWEDGRLLGHYAQTGEEAAFAEVVRRHGGVVLAVCRRVLHGAPGGEDAAQAVFLTLSQKAGELVGRDSVGGWLYQVAWHVAMRAREAAAIRREHEQEAAAMNQPAVSREENWEQIRPALDEELAALPEKYRLPLVLHYLEGRTLEESAKLLHSRLGTVATQVRRGRELLRVRLARRGIVLTGAVLMGLLAQEVSATTAFVASTVQAAGLLTAGHVAASGVVSTQTLALMKGTLKMMFWAKMKMAAGLLAAAMLPIAAGVATWQLATQPAGAQPQIGNPGGNPGGNQGGNPGGATQKIEVTTWPTQITAVDYAKVQAEALRKKIDVSYRRAYVAEVMDDLEKRSAVRVAYPQVLGEGWTFTLEEKGITVQAVLEKLAADGKFGLAQRPETSVLTQMADDQALADLEKQLASPDRWQRCQAVWKLGNLADPRIYPLLTKGLADPDVGVVEWTLKSLERHGRMGVVMGDPLKDAIVKLVKPWLEDLRTKDLRGVVAVINPGAGGNPLYLTMGPGLGERQGRLELLGGTGRPEATAALVEATRSGQFYTVVDRVVAKAPVLLRVGAVRALAVNRMGASELVATLGMVQKELADQQAKIADKPGESWTLGPTKMLKQQVILALVGMRVPEFVRTAQAIVDKASRSQEDNALVEALLTEYAVVLDLRVLVQRELKTFTMDFEGKPTPAPAVGIGAPGTGQTMTMRPGYAAARALRILSQVSDPAVTAEFLKVAKDDKAFKLLSGATTWDAKLLLPVDDPELVAALLSQLKASDVAARFAARCLGQSHDPKVAEALIQALKDVDEESVGVVGEALSQTRDGRALAVLVAMVQEDRDWPDLEAELRDAMKTGQYPPVYVNPRKALVRAMFDTRDPQAFTELAALALNTKLDPEIYLTAQQQLRGAAFSAAEMDRLMELLQTANPKVQREVLGGGSISNTPAGVAAALFPRAPTLRCANDPRFVALLAARASDKDAAQRGMGPHPAIYRNTMIDVLGWLKTPLAEKTTLGLCANPDENVAYFAGRALVRFGDPKVTVQFDQ